ncbi:MAG TPA: 7-cyano-7-deazaguanine synthase QueC [Gemmatimonadaceae bacterium]|nr:7-cyano-7-deazaguanine synthase QueC [Gemmatimonadaceae bacterium]
MSASAPRRSPARAVVLLSGGLDSATTLAIARADGFEAYALTVRYGQRHAAELDAARALAERLGAARHLVIDADLRGVGGSALTDRIDVPKGRSLDTMAEGIPVTYVPARNTVLLSFALAWAEVLGASDIFIGVNAVDYSGYPDCRPAFLEAFERLANVATKVAVEDARRMRVHAPLLHLSKAEIIRHALALGVDVARTRSCYDPDETGAACGECDACRLRLRAFAELGMADPAPYAVGATRVVD